MTTSDYLAITLPIVVLAFALDVAIHRIESKLDQLLQNKKDKEKGPQ
jgi:hypothetical protein